MRDTKIGDDIIDTRLLDERLTELEDADLAADPPLNSDEKEEWNMLADARDEVGDEWRNGVTLIHDRYFERYAEELAEDIGAIDRNASWPNNYIDWEAAARDLQMDYSCITLDGHDYWYRA